MTRHLQHLPPQPLDTDDPPPRSASRKAVPPRSKQKDSCHSFSGDSNVSELLRVAKTPFTESNGESVTSELYGQGSESRSDPTHRGNIPASLPRQTPFLFPLRSSQLAGAEKCIREPFGISSRQESNTGRALAVADVGCDGLYVHPTCILTETAFRQLTHLRVGGNSQCALQTRVNVECSQAKITPRTKVDASGLSGMLRLRGRLPPEVFDSQPQQEHCGDVYSRCPKHNYGNLGEGELHRSGVAGIHSTNTAPGLREKVRYDVVIVNKIAEQLASMGIAYPATGVPHNVDELQLAGIGHISSLKS